jgi:5'-3' exonuclease
MNGTKKRLLLVDTPSYYYRAFHALPEFRSPSGQPTGAILGVVNMLRKLKQDFPSDYIACVFDPPGKTFRDAIYPEYKADAPGDARGALVADRAAARSDRRARLADRRGRGRGGRRRHRHASPPTRAIAGSTP